MGKLWEIVFWWPVLGLYFLCKGTWWFGAEVYGRIKGQKGDKPHGDAAFADYKALKAAGNTAPGGYKVGKLDGKSVYTHHERSVIMFGPTGSGKSLMMEATLRDAEGWDTVVYDPARQLYQRTKDSLLAKGYHIILLDVDNPQNSQGYDLLSYMGGSTAMGADRDYGALGNLLIPIKRDNSTTKYFSSMAQGLLMAGVRYMVQHEPGNASIYRVARLICQDEEQREAFFDKIAKHGDDISRAAVASFRQAGKNSEKGGIANSVFDEVKVWFDPALRYISRPKQQWTWEQVYDEKHPVAVFIQGGVGAGDIVGPYVRGVIGNAINTAVRTYNKNGTKPRKGLKIFIDESAQLGRCEAILTVQRELRKLGVRVFMTYVDKSNVLHAYGKDADLLINDCDKIIPGGISDVKFMEEIVKLVGKDTAETRSVANTGSENLSQFGRNLISVDELRRLPKGEVVVLLGNLTAKLDKPYTFKNGEPVF